jgi:glycerol-3-phosphate acyltransferase PlsX
MRIALDAMGGDFAPEVPVAGAVEAARTYGADILLIGRESAVRTELDRHRTDHLPLHIVHTPQVIDSHEHPAMAVRRKKESSIVVGMRMVRDGKADAFVSAGHSGATMVAATLILGRAPGVERAALSTAMPSRKGLYLLADAGANTDCRPEYLLQFGHMAAVYAEKVYDIAHPRVGLLSNGEEETKGDQLVQEAHALLQAAPNLNFVGNAEPKEIFAGAVDVVVADGFAGNIFLKTTEAVGEVLLGLLREELTRTPLRKLAAASLRPAFRSAMAPLDYSEYGGALLLGLNGVAIIGHGRSNAKAVLNAVRVARLAVLKGAVDAVSQAIASSE